MNARGFRFGRSRVARPRFVGAVAAAVALCSGFAVVTGSAALAQPTTTTTVAGSTTTTGLGSPTTTTSVPQHVINQPNLNALSPHIEMLSGAGVQYQYSSGASSPGVGPGELAPELY